MEGHTLLGIGSELSGGVRNVYMHHCDVPASVHCLFFIQNQPKAGSGIVENICLEDVTCKDTEYLVGLDMDILYQWRELVPTYEERLTHIEGIHVKDIRCGSLGFCL